MPGPPPPPPPGPPPAPSFAAAPKLGSGGGGSADDRGALLKSIRQGAKLKKTVTVDKSAPMISGKTSQVGNNNGTSTVGRNGSSPSVTPMSNGMALGGLFAGGMPKLKATGLFGNSTTNSSTSSLNNNDSDKSPSPSITPSKNFNSIQDQLKRQLCNPSDTRTRGPPPPAPTRNISVEEKPVKPPPISHSAHSNGVHQSQSLLHANVSSLHNVSTLHRKTKSNANLNSVDCTDNVNGSSFAANNKPVINHGKPNVAPKPPSLNGKPAPPTKLLVKPNKTISRAQSMRTPRSPSPQSPTPGNGAGIKFGTVRNLSSVLGQSLNNVNSSSQSRSRPALSARPSVPPPLAPPFIQQQQQQHQQMKPVKPPNHAPPPPPGIPQPPNHAPPPPPYKTQNVTQPTRPPPAIPSMNNTHPPPPPPRHSSMRDATAQPMSARRVAVDLEEKFKTAFNSMDKFPKPMQFRNVPKLYSNRQVSNKQQAPRPPQQQQHLQTSNNLWNAASTC